MAYRKVSDDSLTSVADAIRAKTGGTAELEFPDGFVSAVSGIEAGSGSGSVESYSVNIGTASVTVNQIYLISGVDGAITSVTGTSFTVPANSVLAIYATAPGGSSSSTAYIYASATSGTVHILYEEDSSLSTSKAKTVFFVQITESCSIALLRKTGSGSVS